MHSSKFLLIFLFKCILVSYASAYPQNLSKQIALQYYPQHPSISYLQFQNAKNAKNLSTTIKSRSKRVELLMEEKQNNYDSSWRKMLINLMEIISNNVDKFNSVKFDNENGVDWTNMLTYGIRLITTQLFEGTKIKNNIYKVNSGDDEKSMVQNILEAIVAGIRGAKDPEQINKLAKLADELIFIEINILDVLKTIFSHRSLAARQTGKKDSISEASVASLAMVKSFLLTHRSGSNDTCAERYLCEANVECKDGIGGNSIFCQMGTYATSFILDRTTEKTFNSLLDAGRRGRSGESCRKIYAKCSESIFNMVE